MAGALVFSMATTSHAELSCIPPEQMDAVELPKLGIRKANTVHRRVRFPKDSRCVESADPRQRGIVISLTRPPAQVTISSIAKRKKGMVPIQVRVFDSVWRPVRHFQFSAFTQRGSRRSVAFNLDATNDPRFLLIEIDTGALGQSDSLVAGVGSTAIWAVGGFIGTISNGTEQTIAMPYVESGEVDVEFTRFEVSPIAPSGGRR